MEPVSTPVTSEEDIQRIISTIRLTEDAIGEAHRLLDQLRAYVNAGTARLVVSLGGGGRRAG